MVSNFQQVICFKQAVQENRFGPWRTFKEFVEGELRITERTAYRLIFASRMMVLLRSKGCKVLPVNERQIRPLAALESPREQVLAWNRACANKQKSTPTYIDVQREVSRLLVPKTNPKTDEDFCRYRKHFRSIKRELTRASKMLADGDLETFLLCPDKRSLNKRAQLVQLIHQLGLELSDHFKKITADQSH